MPLEKRGGAGGSLLGRSAALTGWALFLPSLEFLISHLFKIPTFNEHPSAHFTANLLILPM